MKILVSYDEEELVALENMGEAINREVNSDEKVEILREKFEALSPYMRAKVTAYEDNGAIVELDVKADYIRDISGTIATNASKFVAVGKAMASVMEAIKAVTPGLNDLRRIVATALKLEPVSDERKKAA